MNNTYKNWLILGLGIMLGFGAGVVAELSVLNSPRMMTAYKVTPVPSVTDSVFLAMTDQIIIFEGGWTNTKEGYAGISREAHPNSPLWSMNLTGIPSPVVKSEVYKTYMMGYYKILRIQDLPHNIGFLVYDFGISSGNTESAETVQRIVFPNSPKSVDGHIGAFTIDKIMYGSRNLIEEFTFDRIKYYVGLVNRNPDKYSKYGNGWINRAKKAYQFSRGE